MKGYGYKTDNVSKIVQRIVESSRALKQQQIIKAKLVCCCHWLKITHFYYKAKQLQENVLIRIA